MKESFGLVIILGRLMQVGVTFQDERFDLEVPEDRLVGQWHGPTGVDPGDVERLVLDALEQPRLYPPLRQAVVPGDRVVIAFDPQVPHASAILRLVCGTLQGAGVEASGITVLSTLDPALGRIPLELPDQVSLVVHDPTDRAQIAYLSSTRSDRRVYLNRLVTDADFVLPIGRLGYDEVLGYRGPWSTIYPGLSDLDTLRAFRGWVSDAQPDRESPSKALGEAIEVSWLLGSQFHLGVVPGVSGAVEVVAGLDSAVREQGTEAVDRAWKFQVESRAELVVAGIGRPGVPTGLDELAAGLATATRLVQRGGKIVILSRAAGELGPALRKLAEVDDPRAALRALAGHEGDPDYSSARSLANALAWADVYLLSSLKADDVEDLGMVPIERVDEVRRLVSASYSCLVVSQADLTSVQVRDESSTSA
jgi:nickel-dependent lactate racemase